MRKSTLIILGGLILVIAGLILIKPQEKPKEITHKEIAPQKTAEAKKPAFKTAPEFSLKDISGQERRLSDFKDKVVIIDFWATWCPPCRAEIPHFVNLYNQYKDQGLEVIGIALDFNGDRVVPPFVSSNNINYTILLGNEEVSNLYGGITAIPTTFIVDKEGNIRRKYIGYNDKEVFEKDIKELL